MQVFKTKLENVLVIEPRTYPDARGFFMESFHRQRYADAGITCGFVQDNLSYSVRNTLRGLHFQFPHVQAKLIQVIQGAIFDVAVDIRHGSPTFGQWEGVTLSDANRHQLFIPEGFAHGFCVLSDIAYVHYKCSDVYTPAAEGGVIFSDPEIGIRWPVTDPLLSEKDGRFPVLGDIASESLPRYQQ